MNEPSWQTSRGIQERVVVRGQLVLTTPAHLGSGEWDELLDMPLRLTDDGRPLLTGASLAGALRQYLQDWEFGYRAAPPLSQKRGSLAATLLGGARQDDLGQQSPLIVDDAVGSDLNVELRDGVKIDPKWGTAEDRHKFDVELLEAGTAFDLRFELLIGEDEDRDRLLGALAIALGGLARGEIRLGRRRSRGYGRCQVSTWTVTRYDLAQPDHLLAWLGEDRDWADVPGVEPWTGTDIAEGLDRKVQELQDDVPDRRDWFHLKASFQLVDSLLVRSGMGLGPESEAQPDAAQLHAKHGPTPADGRQPVLPGTSLAGALRHRALRIARTIARDEQSARELIDRMFGPEPSDDDVRDRDELWASRVLVEEKPLTGVVPLVQNRIRIDRFTGGAYEGALFNEAPVFGGPDSDVPVEITLRNPCDAEIGLLLLVLKDLWTQDLPVGGEASIGRGRLSGRQVCLERRTAEAPRRWTIRQEGDGIAFGGDDTGTPDDLESYVAALRERLTGEDGREGA